MRRDDGTHRAPAEVVKSNATVGFGRSWVDPLWRGECRRRRRLVDPGRRQQWRADRHPAWEALGVGVVGGAQQLGALLPLARG